MSIGASASHPRATQGPVASFFAGIGRFDLGVRAGWSRLPTTSGGCGSTASPAASPALTLTSSLRTDAWSPPPPPGSLSAWSSPGPPPWTRRRGGPARLSRRNLV